jgi:putative Mg2+ transporter-C (MgtC) family protein
MDAIMPENEHIIRLVAAVILGGIVGLERELRDKPAGFRTIILICVGACLFTILSEVLGGQYFDKTRIAAQVVTGIGFLGAGVILRGRADVFGITTASTIWAVAAIGMAVGFGKIALATLATVVVLVALLVFDVLERWIGQWRDLQTYDIIAPNADDTIDRIDALFEKEQLTVRKRSCYEDGDSLVVHVVAMGAKPNHESLRLDIARSDEYTLRRG